MRETSFDELNGTLKRANRRQQKMKVIRHQNKFMQPICIWTMRQEILKEQSTPDICNKQRASFPCIRRNKVRLSIARCMFSRRLHPSPQGLKPHFFAHTCGTAKAVPFQNLPNLKPLAHNNALSFHSRQRTRRQSKQQIRKKETELPSSNENA